MRFYTRTHTHYCGIDLHANTLYLCILDREGEILHIQMTAHQYNLPPLGKRIAIRPIGRA